MLVKDTRRIGEWENPKKSHSRSLNGLRIEVSREREREILAWGRFSRIEMREIPTDRNKLLMPQITEAKIDALQCTIRSRTVERRNHEI